MRTATLSPKKFQGSHGFMLIEVLVSILIFSLGVLGLVKLQTSMTRASTSSKARADAAYLTSEIIGVMRTDTANLLNYNGSSCAAHGLCRDWQNKVTATLPSATPSILANATSVTVTINWSLPHEDTHTFTTTTIVKSATAP